MTLQDNHNHFCIYCGAKLVPNQHFCSQCGKKVYVDPVPQDNFHSDYESKVIELEKEYDAKQLKAKEFVNKLFDPSHMAYSKFSNAIKKSNGLFDNQLSVTKRMIELDDGHNEVIDREIRNKISTLTSFVDKMDDLINELIIQMSSNKKDNDDINNLFNDMDDLIDSVKDY